MALVIFCLIAQKVGAQNSQDVVISPAYQEIVIDKSSDKQSGSFTLENNTDQELQFQFEVVAYTAVDYFGSLSFFNPSLNESVGEINYVLFDQSFATIAPHSSKQISFRVQNRATLSPGGHYVALVSKLVSDTKIDHQVLPAVASLLLVRKVDGEQINLSLISVQPTQRSVSVYFPKRVDLSFENRGNVHVIPRGTLLVRDQFRRVVAQAVVNEDSVLILPGMRRVVPVFVHRSRWVFPVSFLSLEITGSTADYEAKYSYQTSYFYVSPWFVVGIFCILAGGGALWYRKHKNRPQLRLRRREKNKR